MYILHICLTLGFQQDLICRCPEQADCVVGEIGNCSVALKKVCSACDFFLEGLLKYLACLVGMENFFG